MALISLYRKELTTCAFITVFVTLTTLQGCNNQKNEAKDLTPVTVGITASFLGEAATFTAKEHDFFNKNGLQVVFKQNTSGAISLRDLFSGEVDIAHVAETPVVYALLDTSYFAGKAPSFQIFADMMYADEIQHIIARKDHGIIEPQDIKGKKVGIFRDTQLDYFFDSFLLEHQISKDSVTFVNLDPASQIEAIVTGDVDLVVTWEPYATYIQEKLTEKAFQLNTKLTYSTLWMTVTLNRYAENNPDVLVAYLQAIKEAQGYIEKHPEETQHLLAQKTGVTIKAIKSVWNEINYSLSLSGRMLTLLDEQERWIGRNTTANSSEIDFKKIINFKPMSTVYPEGITVIQ
jgi:NitT/TauT family transport system substrate-binding protein